MCARGCPPCSLVNAWRVVIEPVRIGLAQPVRDVEWRPRRPFGVASGIMRTMNLAASARWTALGIAPLLLACSSPSHPPAEGGSSLHDGGGDSTPGDALAKGGAPTDGMGGAPTDGTGGDADAGTGASEATTSEASSQAAPDGSEAETGPVHVPPQSCVTNGPGLSDCGGDGGSCCASLEVLGGSFVRSYDGVSTGFTTQSAPVAVSGLRLDQYEITVGRFRQFVTATVAGWLPASGSGKHVHLNSGKGLTDSSSPNAFEAGWDVSWNANLAVTATGWNTNLACDPTSATWTPAAGSNERLPIDCVTWFEAYAFCIWDNGFLPSEAEWNYAASGGGEQRVYPWSSPPAETTIDCTYANYFGADGGTDFCVMPGVGETNAVGSESPMGDARWGQADLAGNVFEWNLDSFAPYGAGYPDSAYLASAPFRVIRGGDFASDVSFLLASDRRSDDPTDRSADIGARCARVP
jgi:sulfatase modifying factor 1